MRRMAFGWTDVISDLVISLSYFSIPISLATFAAQQDLRISYLTTEPRLLLYFKLLIFLAIGFIGLCGVTHFISFLQRWVEVVTVASLFKILTALVSLVTAVFLQRGLPLMISTVREIELTKRGLPENLERIHQIVFFTSAHIMSVHKLDDLAFVSVNDAVEAVGMQKELVLSTNLFDFVQEEDQAALRTAVEKLKANPDSTQALVYHVWNPRTNRLHTLEASMFFGNTQDEHLDSDLSHVLIISRDVTDRDLREAAQRERLMFEEGNKARMRYISSIAHDLKTPLTTFQLCLGLLQGDNVSAEQRAVMLEAEVSVEMMSVTIGQALDSARITDKTPLNPRRSRTNIEDLILKCEKIMSNYAKCVPISFNVARDICSDVVTDGEWLWQMCVNLLTNACKYTVRGSIKLDVSVVSRKSLPRPPVEDEAYVNLPYGTDYDEGWGSDCGGNHGRSRLSSRKAGGSVVQENMSPREPSVSKPPSSCSAGSVESGEDEHDMLLFCVKDTGIGVADELKPRLFKAFTQLQSMQSIGTGLGLYSVLQKALRLRGTCGIWDNFDAGGGSVFFFAVPYVPDPYKQSMETPMQHLTEEGSDSSSNVSSQRLSPLQSVERPSSYMAAGGRGNQEHNHERAEISSFETSEVKAGGGGGGAGAIPSTTAPSAAYAESFSRNFGAARDDGDDISWVGKTSTDGDRGRPMLSSVVLDMLKDPETMKTTVDATWAARATTGNLLSKCSSVAACEQTQKPPPAPAERDAGAAGNAFEEPQNVLLVDDTSTVRNLLKRIITKMGHKVDTACTGEEAFHMVERQPYNLVLCDLQMPVMDGPEFTRRWRAKERLGQGWLGPRGKRQPIVGMSANTDTQDIQTCRDSGMDGFIPKPINVKLLTTVLSKCCTKTNSPGGCDHSSGGQSGAVARDQQPLGDVERGRGEGKGGGPVDPGRGEESISERNISSTFAMGTVVTAATTAPTAPTVPGTLKGRESSSERTPLMGEHQAEYESGEVPFHIFTG